jgi:two-component system chemotaxis response regulator CheB
VPRYDIIVIGASSGGVETLARLVSGLPEDLPAAIFVVLHTSAHAPSALPRILARNGPLPAEHATDGAVISRGHIYVAPPDYHLLVERDRMRVVRGPRENRHRPAVDPLFRSAAQAYGRRAVGVVLTGALDDGTAGLFAIKMRGGIAIAQDPDDAYFPDMPASAIEYVKVDYVLPVAEIPEMLTQLARRHVLDDGTGAYPGVREMEQELAGDKLEEVIMEDSKIPGTLSAFTCPECGGPIYELRDAALLRFRCRSGHAFTGEYMLAEQAEALEEALWTALNTLIESAQISQQLGKEARQRGHLQVARRFEEREQRAWQRAEAIQKMLHNDQLVAVAGAEHDAIKGRHKHKPADADEAMGESAS